MSRNVKLFKSKNLPYRLFIFTAILVLYRAKIIDFFGYGIILFGFFFILLAFMYKFYTVNYTITVIVCFLFSLVGIFYFFSDNKSDSLIYYYALFMTPVLVYYSTFIIAQNNTTREIINALHFIIKAYIFFLLFDTIFRYLYVLYTFKTTGNPIESFYAFKHSPVTAGDTNFLALRILFMVCLMFYLNKITHNKVWNKYSYILILFILFTLSRSAIVTVIFLLFFSHLYKLIKRQHYNLFVFEIFIVVSLTFYVFFFIIYGDSSFRTKLLIFESLKTIPEKNVINVLFGFGIKVGRFVYTYKDEAYGHTHLSLIIGQFGIIGLLLYIIFFCGILYTSKLDMFYIILAFIISGLSLSDFGPNFFWVLGIMSVLNKRKNTMQCNRI
jgi:hypothetical protein